MIHLKDWGVVRDVPVLRHFREALPEVKGLFTYFHPEARNWVLAFWVKPDDRIAQEIAVLGPSPAISRERAQEIIRDVKTPVGWDEVKRGLDAQERPMNQHLDMEADERDYWLRRWGKKVFSYPSFT